MSNKGEHKNQGKLRYELLDPAALRGLADVLTRGAVKYAAENYRNGLSWKEQLGSIMRHVEALRAGDDVDPEFGLSHVDHLMARVMMLSASMKHGYGTDDRVWSPKKEDPAPAPIPETDTDGYTGECIARFSDKHGEWWNCELDHGHVGLHAAPSVDSVEE